MNESYHTLHYSNNWYQLNSKWLQLWNSNVESLHIYEWVILHLWMSHVTRYTTEIRGTNLILSGSSSGIHGMHTNGIHGMRVSYKECVSHTRNACLIHGMRVSYKECVSHTWNACLIHGMRVSYMECVSHTWNACLIHGMPVSYICNTTPSYLNTQYQLHCNWLQLHCKWLQLHSKWLQLHCNSLQLHSDSLQLHSDCLQLHSDWLQLWNLLI